MQVAVIGMNQDTASIKIRDQVALQESARISLISEILDCGVGEVVILSTCGRHEVYLCDYKEHLEKLIYQVIVRHSHFFDFPDIEDYLYIKRGQAAILHLYKVTAGLDSIVLGEDQILGQVKKAYKSAIELGASGKILNKLFREAITLAKEVKTTLKISEHPISLSYIGIQFLKEHIQDFEHKKILVIGTGEMASLALEYLMAYPLEQVYITNRNSQSVAMAKLKYPNIIEVPYYKKEQVLPLVDGVITATASPHKILSKKSFSDRKKSVFLLDLAMPRDINEDVLEIKGTQLFNIDSLKKVSFENEEKRKKLALKIEEILKEKIKDFQLWMVSTKVDSAIESLNELREQVEKETLAYLDDKIKFNSREKNIMEKMMGSALKRMIRKPIIRLKELEDEEKMQGYIEAINYLFDFRKA